MSAEDALKPLRNTKDLSLRVNPNGMQPLIMASFLIFSIPNLLSIIAPASVPTFVVFQRSVYFPIIYYLTVFGSNFVGIGESPKVLSKYLNAVRPNLLLCIQYFLIADRVLICETEETI